MSGGRPDFESSPEVFTCRRTLRGDIRSEGSALLRAEAAFTDPKVWTLKRLGIAVEISVRKPCDKMS